MPLVLLMLIAPLLVELQVPPDGVLVKVALSAAHIKLLPVTADGVTFTVCTRVV